MAESVYTPDGGNYGDNYTTQADSYQQWIDDALKFGGLGLSTYATVTGKPVQGQTQPVVVQQPAVNYTPYIAIGAFLIIIMIIAVVVISSKKSA